MRRTFTFVAVAALTAAACQPARAVVQITEWMYNPASGDGEFFEITNRGAAPVNMTGWSFDDSSRTAGALSLTTLGTLAPGESALITELTAAAFRTEWSLAASVKVVGGSTQNLSRSDEINIYDAASALVDRLTYDDQGTGNVNGPRTQGVSANPPLAALGANNASLWKLSTVGDVYGSVTSANNNIGNPGRYPAPEPIPGDFDGDGDVDHDDLVQQWQPRYAPDDLDGEDFLVWQQNLELPAAAAAAQSPVPEPSAALVALGFCALGLRRRGATR